MELIEYKQKQIKELQDKINLLNKEIDVIKSEKTQSISTESWYSLENKTIFFKPHKIDNGYVRGMSIEIKNDKQFPRVYKDRLYRLKDFYDNLDIIDKYFRSITHNEVSDIIDEHVAKVMNYYFLKLDVDEFFEKLK